MNDKQFIETYCRNCGTQRCEGIGTEWFEGCPYRWNHDSYDAATEIEQLNKKIMDMAKKMVEGGNKMKQIKQTKWIATLVTSTNHYIYCDQAGWVDVNDISNSLANIKLFAFEGEAKNYMGDAEDIQIIQVEIEIKEVIKSCEYNLKINKRSHCNWYYKNTEGMNGEAVFHFPFCDCETCPLTNEDVRVNTMTERGEQLKYVNGI